MTSGVRRAALIAAIAFLAGLAGVFIGRTFIHPPRQEAVELHEFLHDHLDLDGGQRARLEALETGFATRKAALENELRQDNTALAAAIEAEHGYGPKVQAAVDRSHAAMGTLQKETLAHIFAMRALMRPDQAQKFDAAVARALTETER